ncbi:MAG: leucine-rich repeat domain-containing protein [Deltaproteobacteria bacterium]
MRIQRSVSLTISVVAVGLFSALAQSARAGLPDKNLEAVVRSVIFDKKDNNNEITDDDLKKVFILEGKGKGIKDLTGLEKCVNLLQLNLAKNEIGDVSALKEIKNLQSLDLSQNKIADVTPLGNVTALQFLELSDNQIESVQPLSTLTKLSALYIAGNKIADLAPLAKLERLSSLDLARNKVTDLKPLTNVGVLSLLKLSGNEISDITPLSRPLSVRMLILENNKLTDLAPFVAAVKADADGEKRFAPFLRLYLNGNPLSDAAKTSQFEALKAAGVKIDFGDMKIDK